MRNIILRSYIPTDRASPKMISKPMSGRILPRPKGIPVLRKTCEINSETFLAQPVFQKLKKNRENTSTSTSLHFSEPGTEWMD